jgi:hypothetical protein
MKQQIAQGEKFDTIDFVAWEGAGYTKCKPGAGESLGLTRDEKLRCQT